MANTTLTEAQLASLRSKLQEERRRVVAVLQQPLSRAPRGEPREFEEVAQRAADRGHERAVRSRQRALLAEVDRALAKMDAGTYGVSEKTGDAIPYARLEAVPWARESVGE